MPVSTPPMPLWLAAWMEAQGIELWGGADLRNFPTPQDAHGQRFPFALAWAVPVNGPIMAGIQTGPNQAYADEYDRVNDRINRLAGMLADEFSRRGFEARALAASQRTDKINIRGDFPHKTAATRAGLGWIGRHCQLITRRFGSWVRLGTVFTHMELPCGPPVRRPHCGSCRRCVEACPAGALTGKSWYPGIAREEILQVETCDRWKKENYFAYHQGHVCGICSAVCPYGLKVLRDSG
ncbi:MAG: 4Fe-4S double cluster binding domain-containing protein [Desulfobaccales bacterium]